MHPSFRKADLLGALVIGEAVAWLLFIMVRVNAPELPLPSGLAQMLASLNTALVLAIALPILSVVGLWVAVHLARIASFIYQAAKFALVGALNTFIDLGILNALILMSGTAAGTAFIAFKSISFGAALVNSYFWNKNWTFRSTTSHSGTEFMEFLGVSVVGFIINVATAAIVVNVIGPQGGLANEVWANVGALAAIVASLGWNFFGYKLWVFKR